MFDLSQEGFKLAATLNPDDPAQPIVHSTRFVLVDGEGKIRGYYDSLEPEAMDTLRETRIFSDAPSRLSRRDRRGGPREGAERPGPPPSELDGWEINARLYVGRAGRGYASDASLFGSLIPRLAISLSSRP